MTVLIVIIVIMFFLFALAGAAQTVKQNTAENDTFMAAHKGWDIFASPYERGVLAINQELRKAVVGKMDDYVDIAWSDINSVEIEKNGQSIQQTNRGSQVVGAAVGAVLLGPLGLLLGGVTGSKRQKERINELSLKLLIDNNKSPVHRIRFFYMKKTGVANNSMLLKEPARRLEHFHALFSNAIKSDHREVFDKQPQIGSSASVEDRLAKLWELRQAGALTEIEFSAQKSAILTPNNKSLES